MYNEKLEQLIDAALADGEVTEKEKQILILETKLNDAEKDKLLQEQNLKEQHASQLKEKDDLIAYYKDLKILS